MHYLDLVYSSHDPLPILALSINQTTLSERNREWTHDRRPPFNFDTATQKARMAEDAWNRRDPVLVSKAYTPDSRWRNRAEFFSGRKKIVEFLTRKWARELDYRLIKELWAFHENRIAVRFQYEFHDDSGQWYRTYGNEQWEFSPEGWLW